MNMKNINDIEYYKSLVTDDEVIQALVRESKAREGELEKTRVRPNLNFFQRTVTNLVSTNTRIIKRKEELVAREKDKYKGYRRKEVPVRRKTHRQLINEILSQRIEFVKSTSDNNSKKDIDISETDTARVSSKSVRPSESVLIDSDSSDDVEIVSVKISNKKTLNPAKKKKSHLQFIQQILIDKPKDEEFSRYSDSNEARKKSPKHHKTGSSRFSLKAVIDLDTDSD